MQKNVLYVYIDICVTIYFREFLAKAACENILVYSNYCINIFIQKNSKAQITFDVYLMAVIYHSISLHVSYCMF